jgi:hypothetical protein
MLGKDIENERCTINHTSIQQLLQVALLRWGKLIIKNHEVKTQLLLQTAKFLRTAFANVSCHIGMAQSLDHCPNNFGTRRTR